MFIYQQYWCQMWILLMETVETCLQADKKTQHFPGRLSHFYLFWIFWVFVYQCCFFTCNDFNEKKKTNSVLVFNHKMCLCFKMWLSLFLLWILRIEHHKLPKYYPFSPFNVQRIKTMIAHLQCHAFNKKNQNNAFNKFALHVLLHTFKFSQKRLFMTVLKIFGTLMWTACVKCAMQKTGILCVCH